MIIDLFSQPHNESRTCAVASNDYDEVEEIGACNTVELHVNNLARCIYPTLRGGVGVVLHVGYYLVGHEKCRVTERSDKRKTHRNDSRDHVDLLLTLLTLFSETLESGDSNGKKLNDDRSGNVGRYRESKQGCSAERITRYKLNSVAEACVDDTRHLSGVNKRNGNARAQTVKDNDKQCEEKLSLKLLGLPSIF